MSKGGKIISDLQKLFGDWDFVYIDSKGLVSRWKS